MKENTWKALIAVIVGGLSAYMQQILIPLIVLAAVMVIDYMSGMLRAWAQEQLSSRIGVKGIVKKLCYLLLICVAGVVDWLIYSGLRKVGISLDFGFCFGLMVTIWLIVNELISILENLAALEVPMPSFLTKIVKHLKNAVEVKGEKDTGGEDDA